MQTIIIGHQLISIDDLKLTPLLGGYTNDSYIFSYHDQSYVLRLPTAHSQRMIDRHLEGRHLRMVEPYQINVPTVYFDEQTGIKVSPFIHGKTLNQLEQIDYEPIIAQMHRLHQIKCSGDCFDVFKQLDHYRGLCQTSNQKINAFDEIIVQAQSLYKKYPLVFSHNDLTPGNILMTNDHVYIIDYEYAGDNIELFDVVSFVLENFLKEKRFAFYQQYFTQIDEPLWHDLYVMECLQSMLWYYWALYMYESTNESIYQEFMAYRFASLQESIKLLKGVTE